MTQLKKYGIPAQSGLIERPHLLNMLDDLPRHRITLLSAPPGCGKTSLLAQYARRTDASVVWHRLNAYQQDLSVMVRHLLTSLGHVIPNVQTLNSVVDQPPEVIAHELSQLLAEVTSDTFILVFDDWQHIGQQHAGQQFMRSLLTHMPQHCHLVILSQTMPALDLISLVARGEILAIPQEDLYFSEAEVYLLASKLGTPASPDSIRLVWEKLRGWPAGTILSLQPMTGDFLRDFSGNGQPSDILFHSIARDMLQQQPHDVQNFLKWTSCVDTLTSHICDEVLRIRDWDRLLADVMRSNLFIRQEGVGYRYHDLFRNFLQTNFRMTAPDDYAIVHRRIAGWHEAQGATEQAIKHYMEAGAEVEAVKLLESIVYSYFTRGLIDTIRQLDTLMHDISVDTPYLDYVRALIALDYDRDIARARQYAASALRVFEARGQPLWIYRVQFTQANILFVTGDYLEAKERYDQLLSLTESYPELYVAVLRRRGMCVFYLGDPQSAIDDMEKALPLARKHCGLLDQSSVLQEMEIIYDEIGETEKSDDCLSELVTLRRQLGNREELALALNNLGYKQYTVGQYRAAREAFQEGLDAIRLLETGRSRYHLYASLGDLERDCGYYEEAREYYQKALTLAGQTEPYMRCETLTHLATLYRWQGREEAALTCVQDAIQLAKQHRLQAAGQQAHIESLHIRLQPYNFRAVERAVALLPQDVHEEERIVLGLRVAHFKDDRLAVADLIRTLAHLAQERFLPVFVAEITNNLRLNGLRQTIVNRGDALAGQLGLLDAARNDRRRPTIIPIKPPASSIQLYTFGAEIVRCDGERVFEHAWQSRNARELFLYLVMHGHFKREEVGLMFWPDKPAQAMRDNLNQVISRMRQVIGNQTVLYDDMTDSYRLNTDVHLWCDALRVDTLAAEGQKLSYGNPRTRYIWEHITQLLTDDFLPSLDRDWVENRRNSYRVLRLDAWLHLARCYAAQSDDYAAARAYQKAIEVDDLNEPAYRELMQCWARLGQQVNIVRTYEKIEHKLRNDLGVAPSQKTQALYHDLLA